MIKFVQESCADVLLVKRVQNSLREILGFRRGSVVIWYEGPGLRLPSIYEDMGHFMEMQ